MIDQALTNRGQILSGSMISKDLQRFIPQRYIKQEGKTAFYNNGNVYMFSNSTKFEVYMWDEKTFESFYPKL